MTGGDIQFEVISVLGKSIRTTVTYWDKIIREKHPIMHGKEAEVKETICNPNEVRQSKTDKNVFLYYRTVEKMRYVCVVIRHENEHGYIITTYLAEEMKEGNTIWKK
jgi:hypothetical protein